MKLISKSLLALLLAAGAPGAWAQNNGSWTLPTVGTREFTLGGSGAANSDLNNSFGGANFSFGQYVSETSAWALRQSINYSNPNSPGSSQAWNGSTRLAFDFHLPSRAAFRPFIGANVGGVYGDAVRDTWAAGLEGGVKMYVQAKTFVYAMADYGWFFRHARDVDDRFRSGQFNWSVGLGFNF
ncbi:MAG: hypothetical protein RIQ93_1093 [Verrucomicrobiota bacterium]